VRSAVVLVAAVALAGCSRTVDWQQEVRLPGGGMVVLQHQTTYERYGDNPLALGWSGWRVREDEFRFEWRGQRYRYDTSGRQRPQVLFIDPATARPILVRWVRPPDCRRPPYVQMQWTGSAWADQPLSPAAHGLVTNLMRHRPEKPHELQARYTPEEGRQSDARIAPRGWGPGFVDPDYQHDDCKPRRAPLPKRRN